MERKETGEVKKEMEERKKARKMDEVWRRRDEKVAPLDFGPSLRSCYLRQCGDCAISAVCLSCGQSVCEQDYCKSNQPMSLKLVIMTGPTSSRKKMINSVGGDPISDTGFWAFFNFPHLCVAEGDFRRFISISHTVNDRFSPYLAKWLTPMKQWIHNILAAVRQTSGSESELIQKTGCESGLIRES